MEPRMLMVQMAHTPAVIFREVEYFLDPRESTLTILQDDGDKVVFNWSNVLFITDAKIPDLPEDESDLDDFNNLI